MAGVIRDSSNISSKDNNNCNDHVADANDDSKGFKRSQESVQFVCVCVVCVCVCACVRACVRGVRACVRACVRAGGRRACVRACACVCIRACVYVCFGCSFDVSVVLTPRMANIMRWA